MNQFLDPDRPLAQVEDFEIMREARLRGLIKDVTASKQYDEYDARYCSEPGYADNVQQTLLRRVTHFLAENPGGVVTWETPSAKNDWQYRVVVTTARKG